MHLPPQAFWSLSLPEWRALTSPPRAPSLTRERFDTLTQEFPDHAQ